MMQKIWICGANGQLGRGINRLVDQLSYEILNTDQEDLDVTDNAEVLRFGELNRPDIIINCAGLTNVKYCEDHPEEAYRVNALGARNLSIVASMLSAKLVQISTDDVFDGKKSEGYTEFDVANPLSVYGKSKLAGENYVREFTTRHFIIRSSWVYGEGENFLKSLLDKIEAGNVVSVAVDHFGTPTNIYDLAQFILTLIQTSEYGVYHATNKGSCSRYEFAKTIIALAGCRDSIKAVSIDQSDFSSAHPANVVLNNFVLSLLPIFDFPDWKVSLTKYMKEMEG